MRNSIRFFAQHPTAANLLMIFLLMIGLMAAPQLKRETFPDFSDFKMQVTAVYPGASAEEVEEAVCQRLQDAVDGISNLAEVTCEAKESLATLEAEWNENGDFRNFKDDIHTEVEAIDNFPVEVEQPIIQELSRTDKVVAIAVSGEMNTVDLKAYAEQLKDKLQRLPGVSLVNIQGFSDHQIRIEFAAETLRRYGLSLSDVANIIAQQSTKLPLGSIETQQQDISIRFVDERHSPAEFADLIIISRLGGGEVRLGEIATITDRFEQDEEKILFNGQRAAIINIDKTKSEDALIVGETISNFVASEQARAPQGINLQLTDDQFSLVGDRLNLLLENGWMGFVLVVLTLWLFFNLRFAFWVAMGLPVSFLGSLFVMHLFGYSINMLSMVGLLIAIGLLMDDAIVISENIATQMKKGKSAMEAAISGTQEVGLGVFSSFLTTVCMFAPLAFLEGDIGKVLKVMPVILLITLTVSLLEAFLILPRHMGHSLQHMPKPNRFRIWFEQRIEWLRHDMFGRAVDWAIQWRYLFVGLVITCFIVSIGLPAGGVIKFSPFPELEGDIIEARILLPQGTPLHRTEQTVERITKALHRINTELSPQQPNQQTLVRNIRIQYNKNLDAYETGRHVATVQVDLLSAEVRHSRIDDVINQWRSAVGALPDVISINFKEPTLGPAGRPIDIRLQGPDLQQLKAASLALQTWLQSYDGVQNLTDDLRPGKPELRFRLKEGALALGLNAETIARQLRAAYFGVTAQEIQVGSEAYEVEVRLQAEDRNSLADLDYFTLTTADGRQIPLSAVAEATTGVGYARIQWIDGQRTLSVQGDVDASRLNTDEMLKDVQTRFLSDFQQRFPDVSLSFSGASEEGAKTGKSMLRGFAIGLFGIFVLLSLQFRSYLEPVVVLVAIPLSLIGALWGHWLMGLEFTMPSMMGFIALSGIVVNDSILLISFLKEHNKKGLHVAEAARQASRDRFRAILLTSLTTIAGMIPLLFETSLQAQILIPLVTSLVFGLISSTIVILLMVPAMYTIFEDFGLTTLSSKNDATLTS